MRRLTDGMLVVVLLVFSGFLYYIAPKRVVVSLTEKSPIAAAESVPGLERGNGLNLAAQRSDFASSEWRLHRLVVKPNAAASPDGSNTAFRLVETASKGFHWIEADVSGISPGDIHTLSVFVKPSGRGNILFDMKDSNTGKHGVARFDLTRKAVVAQYGDVFDAGLQALPDGWYRCWAGMPYATDSAVLIFSLLDNAGEGSYWGDDRSGLLIWGLQLEQGSRVTGYSDTDPAK